MTTPNPARARRRVRQLMRSTVRVYTPGPFTYDPDLDDYVPGPPTTHYEGPGAVRLAGRIGKVVDVVGDVVAVSGYIVSLPGDSGAPIPDVATTARVEVLTCPDMPYLVGSKFTIKAASVDEFQVERRLLCELATT